MLKFTCCFLCLLAWFSNAFATNGIKGSLHWVNGTLSSDLIIQSGPQTVSLKVGTSTQTFTNTYVPGGAGSVLKSGSNFELLLANSTPFAGNFTDLFVIAVDQFTGADADKLVPIGATGVLSNNIGFPIPDPTFKEIALFYTAFKVNNLTFSNGLLMYFDTAVGSYNLAIPNSNSIVTGATVDFPTASKPFNVFDFFASGDGNLHFYGKSTRSSVFVTGTTTGVCSTFTRATLRVSNAGTDPSTSFVHGRHPFPSDHH